jgi:phytoene dehydrogenase-like protein
MSASTGDEVWDVVVIGSGFGGLSTACITSALGLKTLVLESHYAPGGVAHGFSVKNSAGVFHFDTGPSFFCGLAADRSLNPVKHALDAVEERVDVALYDRFCIDDLEIGETVVVCRNEEETLQSVDAISPGGAAQLRRFNKAMRDIHAGMQVPAIALRSDWRVMPVIFRRWAASMLALLPYVSDVKRPVSDLLDGRIGVSDPFVRRLLDIEAFLLSGLKTSGTITAEIAFMVGERSAAMEYPIGGARAIIDAMVRGIEKYGGKCEMNSHVTKVDVKNNRAVGVQVRGRGKKPSRCIRARTAVVSNASVWQTFGPSDAESLIPPQHVPASFVRTAQETPAVESFMHAHFAIPSADLPDGLIGHHAVCIQSSRDIAEPGNTVMISIPTLWSPDMAPPGFHIVHAYALEGSLKSYAFFRHPLALLRLRGRYAGHL